MKAKASGSPQRKRRAASKSSSRQTKTEASARASGALGDVYRAAAAFVTPEGADQYSCNAIGRIEGIDPTGPARKAYERMFAPINGGCLLVVDALSAGGYGWRITALGFAAAMADTGDL